jgi:processed acidic surface protein
MEVLSDYDKNGKYFSIFPLYLQFYIFFSFSFMFSRILFFYFLGGILLKKIAAVMMSFAIVLSVSPSFGLAAPPEKELTQYLQEVGLSKDEVNSQLEKFYGEDLDSFNSVEEVRQVLGNPINDHDLQNLLTKYGFSSEDELKQMLVEYGELEKGQDIRDVYKFMNPLEDTVSFYTHLPNKSENLLNADSIAAAFSEFGLTKEEAQRLIDHLSSLNLDEQQFMQSLEELNRRMEAIGNFNSASDLTDTQITELADIFHDFLNLFHLDARFYLVKNGKKTPLSWKQLITLEKTNGSNLLIELYNDRGEFLADIIFTPDLFGSDVIEKTVNKAVNNSVNKAVNNSAAKAQPKPHLIKHTVKGGQLPNTAGHYMEQLLAGIFALMIGVVLLRKWRVKHS